jgi:Tfp pilus assembly protein PilF
MAHAKRDGRHGQWLSLGAPALLILLILFAYWGAFGAKFLVWDDADHVYQNPHILADDGYTEAWRDWRDPAFYPLTFTTYYWEWRLASGEPWLFHLDNILLHCGNAVMAGLLARRLGIASGVAWAAAGLWALHPVQVASVAWIAERKNVLFVALYLGALLTYARALDAARWWWGLSLVLAVGSLFSKATAVTLPLAVVMLHWACGARFDGRAVSRIAPYFVAAIAGGVLHAGREEITPTLGLEARLLIAARAIWFYVGKFLWPRGLVPVYPRWPAGNPTPGLIAGGTLLAAVAVALWQRHRIPRAAWFAGGFFLVNIALVIGVVWFPYMRYSFVADHLAYTANVGLAIVVALGGAAALRRVAAPAPVAVGLGVCAWLVLAALTRQQVGTWRDSDRLWAATLAVNPASTLAHNNLGVSLGERGRTEEARAHFEAALRADPDDSQAQQNLGVMAAARQAWAEANSRYKKVLRRRPGNSLVWNNLGAVAASQGKDTRAEWFYRKALSIYPEDPETQANLGSILVRRGKLDEAVSQLRSALRADPHLTAGHAQLAEALVKQEHPDEAIAHYEEAHRLAPDNNDVLIELTDLLVDRGELRRAAEYLQAGVKRAPDVGYFQYQLASVLAELGEPARAVEHYDRAIALTATDEEKAELHVAVGLLLEEKGERPQAMARYETALTLDPDQVDAHYYLGGLLAGDDHLTEAGSHYLAVLRIEPEHAQAMGALGTLLMKEGKRHEGVVLLERAVSLDPDDAELRETLATVRKQTSPGR